MRHPGPMPSGRFAPSPTGRLHLGNLRTALVAWLFSRSDGSRFLLRFEDLDTASIRAEHYRTQADDLAALGLHWDEPVVRQSDRLDRYRETVDDLVARDLVYPCFCSRREIREAASAPNRPHSGYGYPGTCRDLSSVARSQRSETRDPALRVRAAGVERSFTDAVFGPQRFELDDFVVRRNDGTPAYHLVVVIDDHAQGIDLVVRADDLLESTARHLHLYELLDLPTPDHAHIPLVLAPDGDRLAKRHGAVDLDDRAARGEGPGHVLTFLASSLGLCDPDEPIEASDLLARFDPNRLPTEPLTLPDDYLEPAD